MKKYFLFGASALMLGLTMMSNTDLSNNNNVGNRSGVLGSGSEGCGGNGSCHVAGNLSVDIRVEDGLGNDIGSTGYRPNTTYRVKIIGNAANLTQGGNYPGWGLQLSAKIGGNSDAGIFTQTSNIDVNVVDGFAVAEQYDTIPSSSTNMLNKMILWKSPNEGSGAVTFYTTVLAANCDGFSGGDYYASTIRAINEDLTSSINDVRLALQASASPNPTKGVTVINVQHGMSAQQYDIVVYNQVGSVVYKSSAKNSGKEMNISVDLKELSDGLYFIHIMNSEGRRKVLPVTKQ